MLLNVLCVVIWHATNINWSTRVRTSFRVNTKRTKAPPAAAAAATTTFILTKTTTTTEKKSHCMENSTQNYARFRNKAQTITCALPKLNTKAPYILNTTPTTALVLFIFPWNSHSLNNCFSISFALSCFFLFHSRFSHSPFIFVLPFRCNNKYHDFSLLVSKFSPVFVYVHLFSFQFSVCLYLYVCIAPKRFGLCMIFPLLWTMISCSLFCMSSMVYVIRCFLL